MHFGKQVCKCSVQTLTQKRGHAISVVGRHLLVSNKGASEWVLGGDGEVNEVGERRETERERTREGETETYGSATTTSPLTGGRGRKGW